MSALAWFLTGWACALLFATAIFGWLEIREQRRESSDDT